MTIFQYAADWEHPRNYTKNSNISSSQLLLIKVVVKVSPTQPQTFPLIAHAAMKKKKKKNQQLWITQRNKGEAG